MTKQNPTTHMSKTRNRVKRCTFVYKSREIIVLRIVRALIYYYNSRKKKFDSYYEENTTAPIYRRAVGCTRNAIALFTAEKMGRGMSERIS